MGVEHDEEEPMYPKTIHGHSRRPRWQAWLPLRRRKKVQTVRLGGKKRRSGGVVRMLRMMRLKWVRLQYKCMMKKLKEYYKNVIKEMMEASATIDAFNHRLFMETTFAIPASAPLSFSAYPRRQLPYDPNNTLHPLKIIHSF